MMKLYFSPIACSLAPHILLEAAGMAYETSQVDLRSKNLKSGGSFTDINPKGQVPTLVTQDKQILTECAIVLQYISDLAPEKKFMPKNGTWERYKANEWLNYISTEIHKGLGILFRIDQLVTNQEGNSEFRKNWIETLGKRFDYLSQHLSRQPYFLGSEFSAVDAYAFAILNWHGLLKIDLSKWPVLSDFYERVKSQPFVQKAMKDEGLI